MSGASSPGSNLNVYVLRNLVDGSGIENKGLASTPRLRFAWEHLIYRLCRGCLRRLRPRAASVEHVVEDGQQLLPHRLQNQARHARRGCPGKDGAMRPGKVEPSLLRNIRISQKSLTRLKWANKTQKTIRQRALLHSHNGTYELSRGLSRARSIALANNTESARNFANHFA